MHIVATQFIYSVSSHSKDGLAVPVSSIWNNIELDTRPSSFHSALNGQELVEVNCCSMAF